MSNNPIVCVAWFESNQWDELKAVSVDSSKLEATYEEWKSNADNTFEKMQSGGLVIHRIQIDIGELVEWSQKKGVPIDGNARSEFAIQKFAQLDGEGKMGI